MPGSVLFQNHHEESAAVVSLESSDIPSCRIAGRIFFGNPSHRRAERFILPPALPVARINRSSALSAERIPARTMRVGPRRPVAARPRPRIIARIRAEVLI